MTKITKTTLALDIINDEDKIVNAILEMFDSSRCYGDEVYDVLDRLKEDYIYGISIFIKDIEYIKSILKKVCKKIPTVRDSNSWGIKPLVEFKKS